MVLNRPCYWHGHASLMMYEAGLRAEPGHHTDKMEQEATHKQERTKHGQDASDQHTRLKKLQSERKWTPPNTAMRRKVSDHMAVKS